MTHQTKYRALPPAPRLRPDQARSTSLQDEGCVTDEIWSRRADAVLMQIWRPLCCKYKLSETLFETPLLERGACLKTDLVLAL